MARPLPPDSPASTDQPAWSSRTGTPLREPPIHGLSGRAQLATVQQLEATLRRKRLVEFLRATPGLLLASAGASIGTLLWLFERLVVVPLLVAWAVSRALLLAPERVVAGLATQALARPRAVALALALGVGIGLVAEQSVATLPDAPPASQLGLPAGLEGGSAAAALDGSSGTADEVRARVEERLARATATLEQFRARHGRYPTAGELADEPGIGAPAELPPGLGQDPWGQPLVYRELRDGYQLSSLGPDRAPSRDDVRVRVEGGRATYRGVR